jgi:hypothetical protein
LQLGHDRQQRGLVDFAAGVLDGFASEIVVEELPLVETDDGLAGETGVPGDHTGDQHFAPIIAELQAGGVTSLVGIAAALNERGIPTARGWGEWTATQVTRVLERLDPFEAAA